MRTFWILAALAVVAALIAAACTGVDNWTFSSELAGSESGIPVTTTTITSR